MKPIRILSFMFGFAALMAANSAYAENLNKSSNTPTPAPWYERFTFGSEFDSGVNAWSPRGEPKATIKVSPKSRWGVTFGLQEQKQSPIDKKSGQASAGAFYDISKNIRVGGGVVLPESSLGTSQKDKKENRSPTVKIESAFRF